MKLLSFMLPNTDEKSNYPSDIIVCRTKFLGVNIINKPSKLHNFCTILALLLFISLTLAVKATVSWVSAFDKAASQAVHSVATPPLTSLTIAYTSILNVGP